MQQKKRSYKKWWISGSVMAVAVVGIVLWAGRKKPAARPIEKPVRAMAEAKYPKTAKENEGFSADDLQDFFSNSARQFLSDTEGGNLTYSPVNVYMALGMLAELTGGNSRQQILDALGSESIEKLRVQASDVWNAAYEDGAQTSILASSLWLDERVPFIQSTLDQVAETYYASAYQGQMGSQTFDEAFRDWLNTQTGGLLENQIKDLELSKDAILALAATIYFKAQWSDPFSASATQKDTFHAPSGDVTIDFMRWGGADTYYWTERFGAVARGLRGGGRMWFILPDEGVSPEELLSDNKVMELVAHPSDWNDQKYLIVHGKYPKFDVTSQIDLCDGLQKLGITDAFYDRTADFTPMVGELEKEYKPYVGETKHGARVKIDEDGVVAAAYTEMQVWCGSPPPPEEEMDFIVNRPFLFVITSWEGLPLFMGIVNQTLV